VVRTFVFATELAGPGCSPASKFIKDRVVVPEAAFHLMSMMRAGLWNVQIDSGADFLTDLAVALLAGLVGVDQGPVCSLR